MAVETIKALSLWQPWASAIALGLKHIETRHWQTNYRGPIAIHAAKRWAPDQREFASVERTLGRLPGKLPLGAVVAIANLVECVRTEDIRHTIGPVERLYGNYADGRYAWLLENVRPVDPPYFCRGAQGLFNVSVPQ